MFSMARITTALKDSRLWLINNELEGMKKETVVT
jgi:hypothetical protein